MSKTSLIRFALLALASAGLWVAVTQQPPAVELTIDKVADDLFILVGGGGNVGVYITGEGVILIDDKFDQHVVQIVAKVRSLTEQPIRYVLNTHHHGDHTGGNQKLLQGADIIAHENARANMVRLSQPGVPRITFADRTSVVLGGKEVRAQHYSRGHTNGDAVIYFPARKTVHMGDMFVAGAPYIDYSAGGSGLEWTGTLAAVLGMDVETVIPGHGPLMKKDDLAQWKKSFETARNRISDLRRQGKTKEEVAKLLNLDDLAGFKPSRNWSERSLPGLFDELSR